MKVRGQVKVSNVQVAQVEEVIIIGGAAIVEGCLASPGCNKVLKPFLPPIINPAAKAPGVPGPDDGFVPKKNWDGKKVWTPRGYGYPDKDGNVWVPSGPGGDGGPHWDVQKGGGSYDNIYPGGKVRSGRS